MENYNLVSNKRNQRTVKQISAINYDQAVKTAIVEWKKNKCQLRLTSPTFTLLLIDESGNLYNYIKNNTGFIF